VGEREATERLPAIELVRLARSQAGGGPGWARRLRREAAGRFEVLGIPSPKDEEWRNTPLGPIERTRWSPANGAVVAREALEGLDLARLSPFLLVTVNGRFAPEFCRLDALPKGVTFTGLERALEEAPEKLEPQLGRIAPYHDRPFSALNTAALRDGAVVSVSDRTELDEPLHVLHVTVAGGEPVLSQPRTLVRIGDRCRLSLIESYATLGNGPSFTNAVTELAIGAASELRHARLERGGPEGIHVGATWARQGRASRLLSTVVSVGGDLVRLDTASVLEGEGADCLLGGFYWGHGRRVVDNHTTLEHAVPHTTSYELYKGILAGRSRAVFNGRIVVRPQAQKTDAKQSNRNLLLSDEATVFTRPQLEIRANDVRCTHGATIGRLDEAQLFYLRSRGVRLEEARAALLRAFAREVLERGGVSGLADALEEDILAKLARAFEPGGVP